MDSASSLLNHNAFALAVGSMVWDSDAVVSEEGFLSLLSQSHMLTKDLRAKWEEFLAFLTSSCQKHTTFDSIDKYKCEQHKIFNDWVVLLLFNCFY